MRPTPRRIPPISIEGPAAISTRTGVRHADGRRAQHGALLENLVHLELRRRIGRRASGAIAYVRSSSGREVDSGIDPAQPGEALRLVQVCAGLHDPETREREIGALAEVMREAGVTEGTVVTLSDREDVDVDGNIVRVRPAWEWALATPG